MSVAYDLIPVDELPQPRDSVCPNGGTENNKALTLSQSGTAFYTGDTTQTCG